MARKYLSPLNLVNLTADPGTATEGDFYWNSSTNKLRVYFDGSWSDAVPSNVALKDAANTFTESPQQINVSSSAVGLIVKANATGAFDTTQWQNSGGTVLSVVDYAGRVGLRTGGSVLSSTLAVSPSSSSAVAVTIRGVASQTANLQEWQNSAGTILASVDSNGHIRTPQLLNIASFNNSRIILSNTGTLIDSGIATNVILKVQSTNASQTADLQQWQNSAGTVLTSINSTGVVTAPQIDTLYVTSGLTRPFIDISQTNKLIINSRNSAYVGLIVQGVASQTANLQEWQNSSGTVIANITPSGGLYVNSNITQSSAGRTFIGGTGDYSAFLNVSIPTASRQGIVIRANASQTANLQEWQNSSGTANVFISMNANQNANFNSTSFAYFTSHNSTTTPMLVRGAASQTANLQEWQDSGGTVLASVSSSGGFTIPSLTVSGDFTVNGTTTNINTTNLVVEDKNIILGDVTTPSNTTADGGGITLKGATDKTFNWVNSTGAWTSSEPIIAPAFIPSGSVVPTNGIYLPAANTLGFATNSASTLQISSTGTYAFGGSTTAASTIRIGRNLTGGTQSFGVNYRGTIQSDVINNATIFQSNPDVAAGSFTVGTLFHFVAVAGSIGAGAAITNQYGYGVDSGFTNATSNFGFYGNIPSGSNRWNFYANGTAANYFAGQTTVGSTSLTLGSSSSAHQFAVVSSAAGTVGAVIRAAASQTAHIMEWQDSSGNILARIASTGQLLAPSIVASNFQITAAGILSVGTATAIANTQAYVLSTTATNSGLVVRGAASQTANLQEWQDSTGAVLSNVNSSGIINGVAFRTTTGNSNQFGNGGVISGVLTAFGPGGNAAIIPVVVKGAASQTANLQEWQNSSGTVLATMSPSGAFSAVTKSFDIPHPTKENMRLRYGSLEGPENGVYVRGRSKEDFIELPDYWTGLVDEDTITVNITPIGKKQDIYVDSIENNKVYLGGKIKEYFFTVYGERKDVDKLTVEY